MTKVQSHVHKFKRHSYSTGTKFYFCTLPDCQFKIDVKLSIGKRSICNRCGDEFILNEYSIRLAKPHCQKCHNLKPSQSSGVKNDRRHNLERRSATQFVSNELASDVTSSLSNRLSQSIKSDNDEDEDDML